MKKVILISLIVVLMSSLVIGGCAAPAPTPAPVIKLLYGEHNPEGSWGATKATKGWFQQIDKATKGRIQIEAYFSETLFKAADAWKAVKTGVADIGWCFHGFWPGVTPLADVVSLPGLPVTSAKQGGAVLWKLQEKYPEIQKEFADVKVLMPFTTSPYFIITTKKQVKTLEDLKGLKLRVIGGPPVDQMKALGGVPLLIPMPDVYQAMQTGVLDGMASPWGAIEPYKFYEVVKYYTFVPLFIGYFTMAMNKDKWNSLPSDVQSQIMSVSGLEGAKLYGYNFFDTVREPIYEQMKKGGYKIEEYTLPQQEQQRWMEVGGKPIWEGWVKKMEAEGRPKAREILNTTLELFKTEKD